MNLLEIIILIFFGLFFILLMYKSMLYNNLESKGAGYGDLPFHLNIISGFSNGCNLNRSNFFKIYSIFFSGENLAYPFITNYFTSILMATGKCTMRAALFFPSSLIILSLLFGIYYLGYEFHNSNFSNLISLIFFINLGGLGWLKLFYPGIGNTDMIHNWGNDQYEYWFHPIMHILIPQRASLWSMPLCYWTFFFLIYGIKFQDWKFFLLASIFTGFTPLVQVHSFVGIAQWSIVYSILTFPFKDKSKWFDFFKFWFLFVLISNLMAFPQFYPFLNRIKKPNSDFIQINPIWSKHNSKKGIFTPFILWWRGLGVFSAVSLIFGWAIIKKDQLLLYLPSIIVFLITNIIRYQPWELDNTKVFYAAWIPFALPVVGQYFSILFKRRTTSIIGLILLISGITSAFRYFLIAFNTKSAIFEYNSPIFGNWIAENTPLKSIFLTSNWHSHPVLTIAGRQGFMGYGGWLLSHGLDYYGRNSISKLMINNPDDFELFQEYNISYVVSRRKEFIVFEKISKFNNFWIKIFDNLEFSVWKRKDI